MQKLTLYLFFKKTFDGTVGQPAETFVNAQFDTVLRQQIDDLELVEPGQITDTFSIRNMIMADNILEIQPITHAHCDQQQLGITDELLFLFNRELGNPLARFLVKLKKIG